MLSNGRGHSLYRIDSGEQLDEEHLLAAKLLIENKSAFESFHGALKSDARVKIAQIANWARILTETVQCYGSRFTSQMRCYKILDQTIFFTSFDITVSKPFVASTVVKYTHSSTF